MSNTKKALRYFAKYLKPYWKGNYCGYPFFDFEWCTGYGTYIFRPFSYRFNYLFG